MSCWVTLSDWFQNMVINTDLVITITVTWLASLNMGRTSNVWLHYHISPSDERIAVCKHCNANVSRGGNNARSYSTSNLAKHLLTKHRDEYLKAVPSDTEMSKSENAVCSSDVASGSVTAKQPTLIGFMEKKKIFDINDKRALAITELIGRMIVIDLQPFSIVEDQGFIELVEHFEPRYVMPSRKYFATTVLDGLYNRCKTRLHQMIENQEFLSLTTDIWTSRARDGFISLTGHFIDSNWNRVSVVFNVNK